MTRPAWAANNKRIHGFKEVLMKLDTEIASIKGRTLKGLIKAQSMIRADMHRIPPTVPEDIGNLDQSYFCVTSNGAAIAGLRSSFDDERKDAGRMGKDHNTAIMESAAEAVARKQTLGPNIIFGFSAYYAEMVHEMYGSNVNWTKPGSGPGYFIAHIKANKDKILKIIGEEARIRK